MNNLLGSIFLLLQLMGLALALPHDERANGPKTTIIETDDSVQPPSSERAVRSPARPSYLDPYKGCSTVGVYVPDGKLTTTDGPDGRGYKNSPRLGGYCIKDDGSFQCSSIELGKCLANRGGTLSWAMDGEFHNSCQSCQFVNNNKQLLCYCYKDEGKAHLTNINLDEYITNINGRLSCNGHESDIKSCLPFKDLPPM